MLCRTVRVSKCIGRNTTVSIYKLKKNNKLHQIHSIAFRHNYYIRLTCICMMVDLICIAILLWAYKTALSRRYRLW